MNTVRAQDRPTRPSSLVIDVIVRQPQHDCPLYTWDRADGALRVTGLHHAEADLPAHLAALTLQEQVEVPILLVTMYNFPPETRLEARVLGALRAGVAEQREQLYGIDGWVLVAVPSVDLTQARYPSLEHLSVACITALKDYVLRNARKRGLPLRTTEEVQNCDADVVARLLRETRLRIKRRAHAPRRGKEWARRQEEGTIPSWRLIEGLPDLAREQLQQNHFAPGDEYAPHAQAEHLIRFVPARFQKTLQDLLLDDERLLAFVERPLLRFRTGLLKLQRWRSNEGIFLVTDRQVLWLRDFFSPGQSFLSGGFIAHAIPIERLQHARLLSAGNAPADLVGRLETQHSPYLRLVIEIASSNGCEDVVVEFPHNQATQNVLVRIVALLQSFLPCPDGRYDRRVRRLPRVDIWQPQGAEAERLRGLGGIVPVAKEQRLRQRLGMELDETEDEALVSVLVPAIEEYRSPVRLIILTRQALVVLEEHTARPSLTRAHEDGDVVLRRYELHTISSTQLRHSLLGSSLSLFVPQAGDRAEQIVLPFHSPAIAWFEPLFTRLRLALNTPALRSHEKVSQTKAVRAAFF